jgi:hypothetical protein
MKADGQTRVTSPVGLFRARIIEMYATITTKDTETYYC